MKELYYQLFECLPDAVIVTDDKGTILIMNSMGEQMFGYKREDYISRPVEMLIPHRFSNKHQEFRAGYASNPHLRPMGLGLEIFGLHKNGNEFPVDVMISPINTSQGLLILSVIRDISERKRAEAAQVSLIAQLQNALKEVRTLRGLIPICGYCRNVRTDTGSWQLLEEYIRGHTEAMFSHGICPSCYEKQLSDFNKSNSKA